MSVQTEQQSSNDGDDRTEAVERFYEAASSFTKRQLDDASVRESVDGEYITVHITDSITSVDGYEVVAVVHSSDETTILYREVPTESAADSDGPVVTRQTSHEEQE